jgi:hypothetical protein
MRTAVPRTKGHASLVPKLEQKTKKRKQKTHNKEGWGSTMERVRIIQHNEAGFTRLSIPKNTIDINS